MRGGKRVSSSPTLAEIRERAARDLTRLPERLRKLEPGDYPVKIADALRALAAKADAQTRN